jgi:hypothetical protein
MHALGGKLLTGLMARDGGWTTVLALCVACGARSDLDAHAEHAGPVNGLLAEGGAATTATPSDAMADVPSDASAAPPSGARCNFDSPDDPSRAALVGVAGARVVLIREDRTASTLYQFNLSAQPDAHLSSTGLSAVVRGSYVAAHATVTETVGSSFNNWQQSDDAALLTLAGSLVWHRHFFSDNLGPSHARSIALLLGRQGTMAVSADDTFLVGPDGHEEALAGMTPLAEPFAGPLVAVRDTSSSGGWWQPGRGLVAPLRLPLASLPQPYRLADRLVYGSPQDVGILLASETADSSHAVVSTPFGIEVVDHAPSGWVLISVGSDFARFNVTTGEASKQTLAFPPGFRTLQGTLSGRGPWFIDGDGSFLVALRNDYVAGIYRSRDGVSNWSLVGRTLGEVEAIAVTAANGTYVIEAEGTNELFVPREMWTAKAPPGQEPELLQRSTQIIRPETNVEEILQRQLQAAVSEDGLCVAYPNDKSSTALSMTTGKTWQIGSAAYDGLGWVE